jgi:hypothetical protein
MRTLEFVKLGKEYKSKHGGKWFHIYFKDETGSYRTALFDNMRNFNNWTHVIKNAERGDYITNLRMKFYNGKEIVDADSMPKLMPSIEEMQNSMYID